MNLLETGARTVTRKSHFLSSIGITQLAGSYEIYAWQRRFESLFLAQDSGPDIFYNDGEYTFGANDDSYTLPAEQYRELENNYHGSENIYADGGFPALRAAGILGQEQTVAVIDNCVPGPSVEFEHTDYSVIIHWLVLVFEQQNTWLSGIRHYCG